MQKIMHIEDFKNPFLTPKLSILWEINIYQNLGLAVNDLKVSVKSL